MSWVCDRCSASIRDDCAACPICSPASANPVAPLASSEAHASVVRSSTKALPQRKYQYNDQNFNAFYSEYPRKRGKEAALRAWHEALRAGADPGVIIEAARRYSEEVKRLNIEPQFIKYPQGWLRDGRFFDDSDLPPKVGEIDPITVVGSPEWQAKQDAEYERVRQEWS